MSDLFDDQNTDLMNIETASSRKKSVIITVIILLLVVILAVSCALVVKHYVISTFVVEGTSMWPTLDGGGGPLQDSDLTNGEILYLNKLAKIRRGDIIVCTPGWSSLGGNSIVKRVIGVAGDIVEIIDCVTYVNGAPIDEPYINGEMHSPNGRWEVGEGEIFCMGDNRDASLDSRSGGTIPLDCVEGRCFLIKGLNGKLRTPMIFHPIMQFCFAQTVTRRSARHCFRRCR